MTCRPKSAVAALGLIEAVHFHPLDLGDRKNSKLGDPITPGKGDSLRAMVDEKDGYLPPVTRVNQPWPIDDPYSRPSGMATPRKDQTGITLRYGHGDPGGHRSPFPGLENNIASGVKVDGGVADMCSGRNCQFGIEPLKGNLHVVVGHRADDRRTVSECHR